MILALLLVGAFPLLSQSLGRYPVSSTPYDPYLDTFREAAHRPVAARNLSSEEVGRLTEAAYDFRYDHAANYRPKTPQELEASGRGDCKDKAVWLFSKLAASGARDLHLVIGKKHLNADEFHAWLYLKMNGRTYLLDPTFSESAEPVSEFSADEYIPVYSYTGDQSFAYGTSGALAGDPRYQTAIPTVASD